MKNVIFVTFVILASSGAFASRPDSHAPIGVMGDHGHKEGEFMFSYRFMQMNMGGLLDGVNEVPTSNALTSSSYMMIPEKMTMRMHMLGMMYGLNDYISLMAMIPYLETNMSMRRRMQNDSIQTESEGISDISISGIFTIKKDEARSLLVSFGLLMPTGSIEEESNGVRLGYPMQIGGGSLGLMPAIVYTRKYSNFSWGAKAGITYFANENSQNYTRGTRYNFDYWISFWAIDSLSYSMRLSHTTTDPTNGADQNIDPMMSPASDPSKLHGNRTDLLLGFNFIGSGLIEGHRLGLEVGKPVYQDLSGPQMRNDLSFTIGYQKMF